MTPTNLLLASLNASDLARLRPHYQSVTLQRGSIVAEPDRPIEYVHFVESGILSVINGEKRADKIEIGMIGREGMSGLPLALGADASPYTTVALFSGHAGRVSAKAFVALCEESATFHETILRYAQAFTVQVAETASVNARVVIATRLARWLLMVHDRTDGDRVPLTHDLIAEALNVRRPGITVGIHVLEGEHLIRSTRGSIEVRDRGGLELIAQGTYGVAERECQRLIKPLSGSPPSAHDRKAS